MRFLHLMLGVAVVACMAYADLERIERPVEATVVSMVGWALLLGQLFWWARDGRPWATFWVRLARIVLLAAASLAVLYAYHVHSHVLEAGVHVDMVYTYVGLEWFLDLQTPITFAAKTFSYPQFPSMVLGHLPAVIVGFDRLGPFAVQLGVMVTVALVLAVVTDWVVPKHPLIALATVVVASAVFSNRLLVLAYNTIGYAPPAICLGLMFAGAMLVRDRRDTDRMLGFLLVASLLHFYTGFAIVLPFCVAWLVLGRRPWSRIREFVRANPLLATVLVMFAVTVVVNPELLVRRLVHVTTDANTTEGFANRLRQHWSDAPSVLKGNLDRFVYENPGSWLLLDAPPLGGLQLPILATLWLASFVALRGRRLRFVLGLLVLVVGLAALTLAQHLAADFMDYRDLTLTYALLTTEVLLVFAAATLRGWRAAAAWALVVAVGVHNWIDVGTLRGRRYNGGDYAPVSEDLLVRVSKVVRTPRFRALGITRLVVVVDDFVALHWLYEPSYRRAGLTLTLVPDSEYCADPLGTMARAAFEACDGFVFVTHTRACERVASVRTDYGPVMRTLVFDSVCRPTDYGVREPRLVTLDDGERPTP